jgi:zinc transporter 5/7
LLLVGAISKLQSTTAQPLDRRKPTGKFEHKGGARGLWDVGSLARTASNILGILLPLYAALHLGGAATALSLLVAVTAGLGSYDQKPGKHSLWDGLRRTIRTRKLTCAVLLFAMVLHVLSSASKRDALLGHIALATSILAIPPPLPTAGWSLMTGLRSINTLSARASLPKPSSPLISTPEDALLTLLAGSLLGVIAVLYTLISPSSASISHHRLAFSALSAASVVLLIFFSLPSALRTHSKSGFALGSFLVAAFGVYEHPEAWQAWIVFPSICVLVFGAVSLDTGSAMFPTQSAAHPHSHSDSGHKHALVHDHHLHGNHSRLSAFLIARCIPGSIIHSILIEKDSRRIAYFGV